MTPTDESIIRRWALQEAVKIATSEVAIRTSVHTEIVDRARFFYDFLRGDVETVSDSSEPASDQ